jgi:hypothetical protein
LIRIFSGFFVPNISTSRHLTSFYRWYTIGNTNQVPTLFGPLGEKLERQQCLLLTQVTQSIQASRDKSCRLF